MDTEVEKVLGELTEVKEVSIHEILINLLDGEQNLDLKTHIFKPKQLSGLFVLGSYLNDTGAKHTSGIIAEFIEIYLRYMVSFNRLSRTEIIKAIASEMNKENSEKSPLTKDLK